MRVRLLAAVAGAALLATSGCTSDEAPEPAPLPTESSSPSDSGSPSPAAPTLPPEAEGTSPAAAKAFALHYVDLVNYASNTGDVSPLKRMRQRRCDVCRGIESGIATVYKDGGRLEGEGWTVTSAQVLPVAGQGLVVALTIRIASERRYESGNSEPTVSKATKGLLDVHMEPWHGTWTVFRLVPNR
ncbi:MAG TPA: DUF6318 family protein [Nocardioides sp.]|uniref:DUF6318 family protein n=1 Tax=Nocardioides sp. TaxID=35761 RepID=UPI002D7FC86B|nr:DUF6318 family protein [Nocardioides sp.]HET6651516.1 DUF6318 family protein [Nocardioides sp.]